MVPEGNPCLADWLADETRQGYALMERERDSHRISRIGAYSSSSGRRVAESSDCPSQ